MRRPESKIRAGMKKSFDVNAAPQFTNVDQRLAAARSALYKTPAGRGGTIKVEPDGEFVKFVVTATGESFSDIDTAFNRVMDMNITDVVSFGKKVTSRDAISRSRALTNKYGAFANILESMRTNISSMDDATRAILEAAGIDTAQLGDLSADIITMGTEKGRERDLAARIQKLQKSGKIQGVTFFDDESARVLSFRYGDKTLNTYQTNLLLSATGNDLLARTELINALSTGNTSKIASIFEKAQKRTTAYVSARDVSLAEGELGDLVEKFAPGTRNLKDITLVYDPEYETLLKYALGGDETKFSDQVGDYLSAFYKNLNAEKDINEIIERLNISPDQATLDAFKKAILDFSKTAPKTNLNDGVWNSDLLKKYLLDDKTGFAAGDKDRALLVENLFKSIEQSYDGSDQMNRNFLRAHEKLLQDKIDKLTGVINSTSATGEQKHQARLAMQEAQSTLQRIRSGELGDITGRGRIEVGGRSYNIKNSFDASMGFIEELKKFGLVLSKSSLKRDTDIAGQIQSIILSGIGNPRDAVFADPGTVAFHPEVFADEQTLKAIDLRGQDMLRRYRAELESGTVPMKVRRILERQASADMDMVPINARASVLRNREFARSILEMLNAGMNPRNAPAMMSMMHNAFAVEAFREVKGFMQPVLPETVRLSLATEKGGSASRAAQKIKDEKFGGIRINGQTYAENAKILRFRAEGHSIFLPHYGPGEYFNSLGGFDLDDKGLLRAVTYEDNQGRKRLGFYMFRQPAGPEEIIFGQAQLDHQTIKALFNNDYFKDTLDEMVQEGLPGSARLQLLKEGMEEGDSIEDLQKRKLGLEEKLKRNSAAFQRKKARAQTMDNQFSKGALSPAQSKKLTDAYADESIAKKRLENTKRRYDQISERLKRLEQLEARGQYSLEEAVLQVYERMETKGLTNVYGMTEEGAKRLGTKGSTLALGDLVEYVTDSVTGERKAVAINPKFTRQGIYKALLEEGSFDMSQDILETLKKYGVSTDLQNRITSIMNDPSIAADKKFGQVTSELAARLSENEAMAIMATTKEAMQVKRIAQGGGNLGTYINRSMIVGSTFNQYEDFLKAVNNQQVNELLFKKYGIGMLAQETVIDLSVNFSSAKKLSAETAAIIADQLGGLDEAAVGKALYKLAGMQGGGSTDLVGDLGNYMMSNLGKQIGFTRAISKNIDPKTDLLLGIDEFLVKNKMTKDDKRNILEGILIGMRDAQTESRKNGGAFTGDILHDSLQDDIDHLQGVLSREKDAEIEELLLNQYSLKASSKYASIGKLDFQQRRIEAAAEAMRRANTAKIYTDPALTTFRISAEERSAVDAIIERNRKALEAMFDFVVRDSKTMTDPEIYSAEMRAYETSENVVKDFMAAARLKGNTVLGLISGFEQRMAELGSRVDLSLMRTFFDESMGRSSNELIDEFVQKVHQVRRVRTMDFLGKFDQENAMNLTSKLAQSGYSLEARNVAATASRILDKNLVPGLTDLEINTLFGLAGRTTEIEDELARQQAQMEAAIVQQVLDRQELEAQGVISSLQEEGIIDRANATIVQGNADDEYLEDMIKSIDTIERTDPLKETKYKRLTKEVFRNDLKEIIENPMVKKGVLGIGALILASFAYTGFKGRSTDDMQGPPMLPGGSSYESDYPTRQNQVGNFSGQGYQSGMSYKVNVYGDGKNIDRFRSAAGGLANGNTSTTMYNRIPDVNSDRYNSIASIY